MEYIRNLSSRLEQLGFRLSEEFKDGAIHYEDWIKAPLLVCIDHAMKIVVVELDQGYQGRKVNVSTLEELETISRILNA